MISAAIDWLEKAGVTIAAHKSEAVLLSSRQTVESMLVSVNGTQVTSKESFKYLGVMIDHRLSFKDNAIYASRRAAITAISLTRLMPNVEGPRKTDRKLLVSVAKATLLYAAPICINAPKLVKELNVNNTKTLELLKTTSHTADILMGCVIITGVVLITIRILIRRVAKFRVNPNTEDEQINDRNEWGHSILKVEELTPEELHAHPAVQLQ
ncbi:uncharacterized protein LOC122625734 [Drosophila teissieri]|uniref:uncharacterized protein LOC122625550 n=1 Tax=Drosophila teissieri TaxID=7243 RepID=UPI001CBA2E90|nr:uncharacterized protein LOC122625550 [Drosophila teissieri]XP_043661740.1 uncharacterized protein LOC122625734 [Drosophila teissieri]